MNLKNYTSTIPIEKTISNIEGLLVEAGAIGISKFYDNNKKLEGIIFQLYFENKGTLTFKLPSNVNAVIRMMEKEIKRPRRDTHKRIWEQAERTAWKLLYDWVYVQVSMILLEQAEALQLFLPYAYNQRTNQTFFEIAKESNFKQLTES